MAERKQKNSFETIMNDLKQQKYAPIYLLMGDEPYFIDRISDFIANNALPETERDFNQTIVYAADITPLQIVELARQYPMMSERQVVIVREAQGIKNWDLIEKYLDNPMNSTILVFCYKNGSIDKRKKIVGKIETKGVVFESKKKYDSELPPFIEHYLQLKGITIERKATQMMADHIGSDLNRLTSELDKVVVSLKDNEKRITPEVVENQVGVSKDFNFFELKNAIVNRNVFKVYQIMKYFDKNPKSGSLYALLPQLFSYFQNLMVAYYAPNKNNDFEMANFLDLKSTWGVRDYMAGMKNYSGVKTMKIIEKIREVDAKSKGLDNPNTDAGELMKELFYFILH